MRIAMIGHKDFPSRSGGVEVVVYELSTRLTAKGHSITVFNRGLQKKHNRYYENGVRVIRTFTLQNPSVNAMLYSLTATLSMVFKRFDVVHYHAIGPSAMLPIAKLFGKRTVATIHGLDWKRAKWGKFAASYLQFGEKMIAKFADQVIVLSKNDEDYFRNRYNKPCERIPNAIEPVKRIKCNSITKLFGLNGQDYILFVSRIVPEKGLHYLIDAYKSLKTDKKLVIAGEVSANEYGNRIRGMVEGSDSIILAGFTTGETLYELYSNCCLFVQPSEVEGLALTLLEALSAGAKCLVSDIPENMAVAPVYTRSFRSGDANNLAQAISASLDEGADYPLMNEQIEYIANTYSYDRVIDATLKVYEKTADRKNRK